MLIVGGVNFFPSQLESILLGFPETAPHYTIRLGKKGFLDEVSADVETVPTFWGEADADALARVTERLEAKAKDLLGFRVHVKLTAPHSVPRSEGKSKRVFDER